MADFILMIAGLAQLASIITLFAISVPAFAQERSPDLKTVLRRAADYAGNYHVLLSTIVAEERYVQRTGPDLAPSLLLPGTRPVERERVLRSDFVIVSGLDAGSRWLAVREVLELDGQPVEGEHGRIEKILGDRSTGAATRLRALADAQAKYNLGDLYRTINVPTFPLEFLLPDRQRRFRFKRSGTANVHGTEVWTITFQERERPTLIRTPEGTDVVSTGVFWIDPQTGAVLRTELRAGENMNRRFRAIILVGYARHERFDMLLPDDMNELYITGRARIEGHATYGKFRRFEVDTRIK
jgi:hypothetical protein